MAKTRTALRIIERAFSKAGVKTAEEPLSASEIEDGLDALNDLLASWGATGTIEGIDPIMNPSDELITPREADWALKSNLAVVISGEYGIQVNQILTTEADNALSEFVKSRLSLTQIAYPSTLPKGSGNYHNDYEDWNSDFFPADKKENF
jgi:hypothetical protein